MDLLERARQRAPPTGRDVTSAVVAPSPAASTFVVSMPDAAAALARPWLLSCVVAFDDAGPEWPRAVHTHASSPQAETSARSCLWAPGLSAG